MTVDELVDECERAGVFAQYDMPRQVTPIHDDDGRVVGFCAPKRRKGRPGLGMIYIGQHYRRQGHATRAAQAFLDAHPDMTWHAEPGNAASRAVAERIGLIVIGEDVQQGHQFMIYGRERSA